MRTSLTKAEIRRRQAKAIQHRQENLRYEKSQRLDDLVEQAALDKRRRRKRDGKSTGFVTRFEMPSSVTQRKNKNKDAQQQGQKSGRGAHIKVTRRTASDDLFEKVELPTLAAFVALSISTAYGLEYWERRLMFVVVAIVVAMVRRWFMEHLEIGSGSGSGSSNRSVYFIQSFTTFTVAVLSGKATHVMPVAWFFLVYMGLVGKWWVRSFAACVAFCVRFTLEIGRERLRRRSHSWKV